jgi:hypothetical protein
LKKRSKKLLIVLGWLFLEPLPGIARLENSQKFFASFFVTVQVWTSPPRKESSKESGSF